MNANNGLKAHYDTMCQRETLEFVVIINILTLRVIYKAQISMTQSVKMFIKTVKLDFTLDT